MNASEPVVPLKLFQLSFSLMNNKSPYILLQTHRGQVCFVSSDWQVAAHPTPHIKYGCECREWNMFCDIALNHHMSKSPAVVFPETIGCVLRGWHWYYLVFKLRNQWLLFDYYSHLWKNIYGDGKHHHFIIRLQDWLCDLLYCNSLHFFVPRFEMGKWAHIFHKYMHMVYNQIKKTNHSCSPTLNKLS